LGYRRSRGGPDRLAGRGGERPARGDRAPPPACAQPAAGAPAVSGLNRGIP
jgi:hypothetical protein